MARKKALKVAEQWLVAVGAANWGLVQWLQFNLVDELALLVNQPVVGTVVYSLVGIAGILQVLRLLKVLK